MLPSIKTAYLASILHQKTSSNEQKKSDVLAVKKNVGLPKKSKNCRPENILSGSIESNQGKFFHEQTI